MNSIYSSSLPLRRRCNRSHILHPWPNAVTRRNQMIFFAVLDVLLNNGL